MEPTSLNDKEKDIIKMQSKYSQNCRSCNRLILLNEKVTYLCTKCNFYFCEECANFLNDNEGNVINNCPGGNRDPHDSIMVKITRNIKEYSPLGISIDNLEKKNTPLKKTLKILDSESSNKSARKSNFKILED